MSNTFDNKKLNILIIGTGMYVCGRGTDGYGTILPAIYEWKRSGLAGDVYIAGTQPEGIRIVREKAEELNKLLGFSVDIKYYPEQEMRDPEAYKKAINDIPRPACAVVVVPDHLHRAVAGYAVENSMHTLVVKPLAPTLKETLELVEIQERHNVYCAVEFHKRLDRSNIKLKDTLTSGKIGEPLYFIVEYSQRKSIPTERFAAWVKKTNIFQYLGIHYVDIVYWATGAVPLRVMAAGQKNFLVSRRIDAHDSIQAVVEWKTASGSIFTSSFFTNWIDPENSSAMSDQKIKVIGTKGRYEADQKNRGIRIVTDENGIEEPNPDFCSMRGTAAGDVSFYGYGIESVRQFFDDVCSIESGALNIAGLEGRRPAFKDSIIPAAIIEAVNKSLAENSRWIEIRFNDGKSISIE